MMAALVSGDGVFVWRSEKAYWVMESGEVEGGSGTGGLRLWKVFASEQ